MVRYIIGENVDRRFKIHLIPPVHIPGTSELCREDDMFTLQLTAPIKTNNNIPFETFVAHLYASNSRSNPYVFESDNYWVNLIPTWKFYADDGKTIINDISVKTKETEIDNTRVMYGEVKFHYVDDMPSTKNDPIYIWVTIDTEKIISASDNKVEIDQTESDDETNVVFPGTTKKDEIITRNGVKYQPPSYSNSVIIAVCSYDINPVRPIKISITRNSIDSISKGMYWSNQIIPFVATVNSDHYEPFKDGLTNDTIHTTSDVVYNYPPTTSFTATLTGSMKLTYKLDPVTGAKSLAERYKNFIDNDWDFLSNYIPPTEILETSGTLNSLEYDKNILEIMDYPTYNDLQTKYPDIPLDDYFQKICTFCIDEMNWTSGSSGSSGSSGEPDKNILYLDEYNRLILQHPEFEYLPYALRITETLSYDQNYGTRYTYGLISGYYDETEQPVFNLLDMTNGYNYKTGGYTFGKMLCPELSGKDYTAEVIASAYIPNYNYNETDFHVFKYWVIEDGKFVYVADDRNSPYHNYEDIERYIRDQIVFQVTQNQKLENEFEKTVENERLQIKGDFIGINCVVQDPLYNSWLCDADTGFIYKFSMENELLLKIDLNQEVQMYMNKFTVSQEIRNWWSEYKRKGYGLSPTSMVLDSQNNLYIAMFDTMAVAKIDGKNGGVSEFYIFPENNLGKKNSTIRLPIESGWKPAAIDVDEYDRVAVLFNTTNEEVDSTIYPDESEKLPHDLRIITFDKEGFIKDRKIRVDSSIIDIPDDIEPEYDSEVEYLETDGKCCIDTGINISPNIGIKMDFYLPNREDESESYILGNIKDWDEDRFAFLHNGDDYKFYFTTSTKDNQSFNNFNPGTWQKLSFGNGIIKIDDISKTYDPSNIITTGTLRIFGRGQTTGYFGLRIKSCRIFNGDKLICDLIPVRKNGIGCMYDKISKTILEKSGTGQLTYGKDVPSPEKDLWHLKHIDVNNVLYRSGENFSYVYFTGSTWIDGTSEAAILFRLDMNDDSSKLEILSKTVNYYTKSNGKNTPPVGNHLDYDSLFMDEDKTLWFSENCDKTMIGKTATTSILKAIINSNTELWDCITVDKLYGAGSTTKNLNFNDVIERISGITASSHDELVIVDPIDKKIKKLKRKWKTDTQYSQTDLEYNSNFNISVPGTNENDYEIGLIFANGDWSGMSWVNKYCRTLKNPLTTIYDENTAHLYSYETRYIRKHHDEWDVAEHMKIPVKNTTFAEDNEQLFNAIGETLGIDEHKHYSVGRKLYEGIANQVANVHDIDECHIDSIYAISKKEDVNIDKFIFNYPEELRRISDLSSITRKKLWGDRCRCDQNYFKAKNKDTERYCDKCRHVHASNVGSSIDPMDCSIWNGVLYKLEHDFDITENTWFMLVPTIIQVAKIINFVFDPEVPVNCGSQIKKMSDCIEPMNQMLAIIESYVDDYLTPITMSSTTYDVIRMLRLINDAILAAPNAYLVEDKFNRNKFQRITISRKSYLESEKILEQINNSKYAIEHGIPINGYLTIDDYKMMVDGKTNDKIILYISVTNIEDTALNECAVVNRTDADIELLKENIRCAQLLAIHTSLFVPDHWFNYCYWRFSPKKCYNLNTGVINWESKYTTLKEKDYDMRKNWLEDQGMMVQLINYVLHNGTLFHRGEQYIDD